MDYKGILRIVMAALSFAVAALLEAMGGNDRLAIVLVIAMCTDYATGIACAAIWHKSPKSENGGLESRAGLKGLFRKMGIVVCVILANYLSLLVSTSAIRDSTIIFFICNETLSIIENLGIMGVPFPPAIRSAIDVLKKKSEEKPPADDIVDAEVWDDEHDKK